VTLAGVTAALALLGYAFIHAKNQAEESTGYAVTWAEAWGGAADYVGDKMLQLAKISKASTFGLMRMDQTTLDLIKQMDKNGGPRTLEQAIRLASTGSSNSSAIQA
jgi:hypothetical protein